jgi:hypothetical protein
MPGKIFIFSGNTNIESSIKKLIGYPKSDVEVHQASDYYSTLKAFTVGNKNPKNYQLAIFDSSRAGLVYADDLRGVFAGQARAILLINSKWESYEEKIIKALKECFPKLLIKNIDAKIITDQKTPAQPAPAATPKAATPRPIAGSIAPRSTRL